MSVEAAVAAGFGRVRARLLAACERAGRAPESVRLVAVSKRHPPEAIRAAYALGQREFGENYAQELVHKATALTALPELRWRMVGHLQRNKVKDVVPIGASVDGVDSVRLASALDERARAAGRVIECLVQVNLAGEQQKSGAPAGEVPGLVAAMRGMAGLRVVGLMMIGPAGADDAQLRGLFRRLKQLGGALALPELSMGMSDDLEIAVEEGATMVRVGTALFGPRPAA